LGGCVPCVSGTGTVVESSGWEPLRDVNPSVSTWSGAYVSTHGGLCEPPFPLATAAPQAARRARAAGETMTARRRRFTGSPESVTVTGSCGTLIPQPTTAVKVVINRDPLTVLVIVPMRFVRAAPGVETGSDASTSNSSAITAWSCDAVSAVRSRLAVTSAPVDSSYVVWHSRAMMTLRVKLGKTSQARVLGWLVWRATLITATRVSAQATTGWSETLTLWGSGSSTE
jgi:hypothetical protein